MGQQVSSEAASVSLLSLLLMVIVWQHRKGGYLGMLQIGHESRRMMEIEGGL